MLIFSICSISIITKAVSRYCMWLLILLYFIYANRGYLWDHTGHLLIENSICLCWQHLCFAFKGAVDFKVQGSAATQSQIVSAAERNTCSNCPQVSVFPFCLWLAAEPNFTGAGLSRLRISLLPELVVVTHCVQAWSDFREGCLSFLSKGVNGSSKGES